MWTYKAQAKNRELIRLAVESKQCIYCGHPLDTHFNKDHFRTGYTSGVPSYEDGIPWVERTVRVCTQCGWWKVRETKKIAYGFQYTEGFYGATGGLMNLDVTDQSVPIDEIKGHLAKCFDDRYLFDPWKLEDIVASVYKGLGFYVRVTGRTNDGGIDVVLDGGDDETIGVQVKRYKNTVGVEQIRAFAGALLAEGFTKGIFVTTSAFTKGGPRYTAQVAERGIAIELVDSARFYEALEISQHNVFEHLTDRNYHIAMIPLTEDTPDSWAWGM